MIRRLSQCGKKSFSVNLPKTWVLKNNLRPKSEIEISESGNNLIISAEIIPDSIDAKIILGSADESEDILISKLVHAYREGHKEIRLIHKKENPEKFEKIYSYAQKFHGVSIKKKENVLILQATDDVSKRSEILNKCFHNLLLLSEMIADNTGLNDWERQVFDVYERIYFLSEYLFRIVTLEGSADFNLALKNCSSATFLQCIAEVLKKVAEIENDTAPNEVFGSVSQDLKKLIRSMYETCMLNKEPKPFYEIRNSISSKIVEKRYNMACTGYAHMCEYLCTKLVRMGN